MKRIVLLGMFFLYVLTLYHMDQDIYKLTISMYLLICGLLKKQWKTAMSLVIVLLADYCLAFESNVLLGVALFIVFQLLMLRHPLTKYDLMFLILPMPLFYRMLLFYLRLLLYNLYDYRTLGFICLFISDIWIGLHHLFYLPYSLYMIWIFYIPALFFIFHQQDIEKNTQLV